MLLGNEAQVRSNSLQEKHVLFGTHALVRWTLQDLTGTDGFTGRIRSVRGAARKGGSYRDRKTARDIPAIRSMETTVYIGQL